MPLYSYENGEYVLFYRDNGDVISRMEEVALVFSKDDEIWTLHKHGSKERVEEWYNRTRKRLRDAGFPELADDLVMVAGKFPVDELNHCIQTSGYVKRVIEKLGLEV